MHDFLFFQLTGPMASWGETAVGEIRPTQFHPTRSAILGILAAAMGIKRTDEQALLKLSMGYCFSTFVQNTCTLLRDYHTIQAPSSSKKMVYSTRREELSGERHKLNTLLSSREYLNDSFCYIGLSQGSESPFTLEELQQGLRFPKYLLYLGRKACPVSLPLYPLLEKGETLEAAFTNALLQYRQKVEQIECLKNKDEQFTVYWEPGISTAFNYQKSFKTRDQAVNRKRWQFQERTQFTTTWKLKKEE